ASWVCRRNGSSDWARTTTGRSAVWVARAPRCFTIAGRGTESRAAPPSIPSAIWKSGTSSSSAMALAMASTAGRKLGIGLLFVCVVAQFFCGMASVTANSRMVFAFSRDGALPGSSLWRKVNARTGTPTNSVWLCVVCSTLLVLPSLWSTTAYLAATSIAVIGLYIAYVAPVLLRRLNPDFQQGDWNLGKWSALVGWVAIVWVAIICVLFVLPTASPITAANFNYTIVAVAVVVGGAWLWWILGARKWFTG